jgi:glycosyltransferase involved in cell wall biosynthesis
MISIITPVYNGEHFIEACIQNVIDQNCWDVEHIIVDGDSSDRTVAIVQQYAKQYPHIRWISEKDQGQSDAMNKGIALAYGEIISFLNVDDFYQPNVLNQIQKLFEDLPEPALLVGNCNILDDSNQIRDVNRPSKLSITDLLLFKGPFPWNPSAYFYHKSLHQEIGPYRLDEHYNMDIDFVLRSVQVATVKYVDEVWGNYRQISGTKTVERWKNGDASHHFHRLLKEYIRALPWPQRLAVVLGRGWLKVSTLVRRPTVYRASNP